MTDRELMQQALEALEEISGGYSQNLIVALRERLAQPEQESERNKLAAWMMQRSYATGHGDTIEDLLKQLEWQIAERECEACAKVCDELAARDKLSNYYAVAAKAIRARGNT